MKLIAVIIAVAGLTMVLLSSGRFLPETGITLHNDPFVSGLLRYQILALFIALAVLLITLKVSPESRVLLKFGDLKVIALKEKWLGVNGKDTWRTNALQLSVFISLATGIFMFLGVKSSGALGHFQWHFVPFIILLSVVNSFSEEIIYRFAINGNLSAVCSKTTVLLVSAILFGLPHYWGNPSGITGAVMAGLLGYILSKATYETQGLGIAWCIHCVQDIIIFTALFMMQMKS